MVPAIQRQIREQQLVEVIDQMQPESIAQIKSLVAAGADVRTRGHDNSVAMVAAFWNDPELLQMALSAGVDRNAADPFGNTALHLSSFAPSVEPLRLLLSGESNVNVQNKRGETPLMHAVRNAQFDHIKLLLKARAKVDVVSHNGETALSIAKSLQPGGPRPMRPDLTANDFIRLLNEASERVKH